MAEHTNRQHARTAEPASDKKFPLTFQGKPAAFRSEDISDEFISSLAESYENRRAVQVFKWEAARLAGLAARSHYA